MKYAGTNQFLDCPAIAKNKVLTRRICCETLRLEAESRNLCICTPIGVETRLTASRSALIRGK